MSSSSRPLDEVKLAIAACHRHLAMAAAFSLALNLLYLAAPLYMMQIYDRVIGSGSKLTLAMLTLVVLLAFAALAGLDRARSLVLVSAGMRIDRLLAGRVFTSMMQERLQAGSPHDQALRDLDTVRHCVSGHGVVALFDLPWTPIYVAISFSLHWLLGLFALVSAALLCGLAVLSEWQTRPLARAAQAQARTTHASAEAGLRNAQAVQAMAMMPGLLRRWLGERSEAIALQTRTAEYTATIGAVVRFLRLAMQSLVLGVGAWLVVDHATSPGSIFAASLLLGRTLQPVELVIGQWQTLLAARAAHARIADLLVANPPPQRPFILTPARPLRLTVENTGYAIAERTKPILDRISLAVEPGECVGLIGPSGAGKSTLSRLLVGTLAPTAGAVRFGGIDMSRLVANQGGEAIGYMPQDVELFGDTVAANIARFRNAAASEIVQAAQLAGAHELIVRLPRGYHTEIGDGGTVLSGGMRQRIALARAVFGSPRLVVLDEPSSNLDDVGDAALARCIQHLQARGTTLVLVSHRPQTLATVHKFIVLADGRLMAFGSRAEIMQRLQSAHGIAATGRPRQQYTLGNRA